MKKALITLMIVALAACERGADKNTQAARDSAAADTTVAAADRAAAGDTTLSNRPMNPGAKFDPQAVGVGAAVAGVRVASKKIEAAPASRMGVTGSLTFKGELTLAGSYRAHYEYPEVKEACFWVDPQEWPKVPRAQHDDRIIWFCFTNKEQAIQQLGPLGSNARATIVIDDYTTNLEQSDVWDTARLVRVIRKEKM